MIRPQEPGVRRLQEEVARDPGSPAFVPLADLYRAQGRLDVARRVCIRGLERHPNHVEGHYLLGRIYRDRDEPDKAYDEWDIALRLDPLNVASRRAIAFLCLEQGKLDEAERHLRQAMTNDPDDPRIRRALKYIQSGGKAATPAAAYWETIGEFLRPRAMRLARESRARFTLLIDSSGRVLTQYGFSPGFDMAAFASLVAGVHSASHEIARLFRQPGFKQLYQGRGEHQLFVGAVPAPPGELLAVVVFGDDTTIGLVRAIFKEFLDELADAEWPGVPREEQRENLEEELSAGLARVRRGVDGTSSPVTHGGGWGGAGESTDRGS